MAKFTINLKNSSIDLPDDVGTYVVSTGCGSGKTHWLKGLFSFAGGMSKVMRVCHLKAVMY